MRAASSVVVRGRVPSSISALRTYFCCVAGSRSCCFATRAIAPSRVAGSLRASSASLTARSRISAGYGTGMMSGFLSVQAYPPSNTTRLNLCSPLFYRWSTKRGPDPHRFLRVRAFPQPSRALGRVSDSEVPILAFSERPVFVLPDGRREILRLLQLRWPLVPSTCHSHPEATSVRSSGANGTPSSLVGSSTTAQRNHILRGPPARGSECPL